MSPEHSPGAEAAAPPRRRRGHTLLHRLSHAVREQSWFAVVLELVIVVAGIVIGFQVAAWDQARTERVQERVYLRQLAADLAASERLADEHIRNNAPGDTAITDLLQSSYREQLPPRDSVLQWFRTATRLTEAVAVLGTAEALITTGDLVLLRDDSLRVAITAYVEASRRLQDEQAELRARWWQSHERLRAIDVIDFPTLVYETTPPARRDSIAGTLLFSSIPAGPRVAGAGMTPESLLRDRRITAEIYTQLLAREWFFENNVAIRQNAADLRRRVEAALARADGRP